MKGRAIQYLPEELAWIEARRDWPRAQLHSAFAFQFGRKDVSQANLASLCKRMGWMTGRDGRFHANQISHNKGKKGFCAPGSEKGHFKKGSTPANILPLWSERTGKDGYIEMKVPMPNPWTGHATRFYHKHRWLWEQANGPVPAGHALKCLDGNKLNTDPANWQAIPRAMLPRLNNRHGRQYDTAPDELKPTLMLIAQVEHKAAELNKDKGAA